MYVETIEPKRRRIVNCEPFWIFIVSKIDSFSIQINSSFEGIEK